MRSNSPLTVLLFAGLVGFVIFQMPHDHLTPLRIAGLVLALLSLGFWVAARWQLGSSFSVGAQAKQLVTRGLYGRIRNPVYVFGALLITGLILYSGQLWWLLALLVLAPVQILRARKEAMVLEAAFGDEYRAWRARTWF